jgi:hypothetical protein
MKTTTHSAFTFLADMERYEGFPQEFIYHKYRKMIPYALLPDAIRRYVGPRQASHFENGVDGGNSWMEFPEAATLKVLSKENVSELVKFSVLEGIKPCVIGEYTNLPAFNAHNLGHTQYIALATHMVQDDKLDYYLREKMIDVADRYDDKFVIRHSGEVIDGKTLRQQVSIFEDLLFLKIAGIVYHKTRTVLNARWFEENVYSPLCCVYSQDLADGTFKFMKMSDELNARIEKLDFELTDDEKKSVTICEDVDAALTELCVWAYWATKEVMA